MANHIPKTSPFTLKRIIENLGAIPEKGFAEETPKLSTEDKQKLMKMASMYENYGQAIANEEAIVNSAKCLAELCELASTYALNECGDWFQADQVKKDMNEVKKKVGEYNKIAKECYARMQQLGCAYQDIGHVLGRYYDLKKAGSGTPQSAAPAGKQPLQNESSGQCKKCGGSMGTELGNICKTCKSSGGEDAGAF